MAYDQEIDARLTDILSTWEHVERKKMFGGVCYLWRGNMLGGVHQDFLILRLGETEADRALGSSHVRPFDITGRAMKGWVMVAKEGFESDSKLKSWLKKAREFVEKLPSK